jgi:uncharacterized membrane protein
MGFLPRFGMGGAGPLRPRHRRVRDRPAADHTEPQGPGPVRRPLLTGGFSGAALGAVAGSTPLGLIAGVVGAVAGTWGGAALRSRLAGSFGSDRPAAFIEDAGAVVLALIAVSLA